MPESRFPYVEKYLSSRMGCDLSQALPGQTIIIATSQRLECEPSYDEVRVLWWLQINDGRSIISVPPGAESDIQHIINDMQSSEPFGGEATINQIRDSIDRLIVQHGINPTHRAYSTVVLACDGASLQKHEHGECRRLIDTSLPTAGEFRWPPYTFIEGTLYAVIVDNKVVSVATARPTGVLEDRVADISIATAVAYQRKGYGQTAVSALTEHYIKSGGEALYIARPENKASVATALSVGFVDFGKSLTMRASYAVEDI